MEIFMMNIENSIHWNRRDELLQLQLERVQSTINRAYRHVEFHRNRLDLMGIDPSSIESLDDLSRLPFMTRNDLSEHYPYALFAVPLKDIVRIHTAPGIGRNPSACGYTQGDLATWSRIVSASLHAAGVSSHDILQIHLHPGLANWGRDYKNGAEALGASVIPNMPLSVEKLVMILRDYKTTTLVTTPAAARNLAQYIDSKGTAITSFSLRTIICIGEPISDQDRALLETVLQVDVWQHYGLSDVPGPAIAFACNSSKGLHIQEDHFFAEIIDPETGRRLAHGDTGELVLTTLTARAFPLIRFRTGDRATMINDECGCQRTLTRIIWHKDRTDGLMNIDGVITAKRQVLNLLAETIHGIRKEKVRFEIMEKGGKRLLVVFLPVSEEIFSDEIKELERMIHYTENRLTESILVPIKIKLTES